MRSSETLKDQDSRMAHAEPRERYYGVRATLSVSNFCAAVRERSENLFGYVALVNPLVPNDIRLKVGVTQYRARGLWALFVWSAVPRFEGGIRREVEIDLVPGKSHQFELRFARDDHTRFELLVNGSIIWRDAFAKPISRAIYDGGGVNAKVYVEKNSRQDAVSLQILQWSHASGAVDPSCKTWTPLAKAPTSDWLQQNEHVQSAANRFAKSEFVFSCNRVRVFDLQCPP
jgi:hypothetical protein